MENNGSQQANNAPEAASPVACGVGHRDRCLLDNALGDRAAELCDAPRNVNICQQLGSERVRTGEGNQAYERGLRLP
jgi:hypothetical protein